jgi:hypothetical protein
VCDKTSTDTNYRSKSYQTERNAQKHSIQALATALESRKNYFVVAMEQALTTLGFLSRLQGKHAYKGSKRKNRVFSPSEVLQARAFCRFSAFWLWSR